VKYVTCSAEKCIENVCLKIPEGVGWRGESFCKIGVGGRVKVKVNLTLEQATKAQRGSR
jgi:hypothetical protein